MYTIATTKTRLVGFVFSVLMSTAVLSATVLSMQAGAPAPGSQVVALERVVITAPAVN
jgi:hypothetical protein